jgi:hypothetical protein
MKQKRAMLIGTATCGLVLAIVLVSVRLGPKEPEYQGRKLSEWMDVYSKSTNDDQTKAEDAIRAIGTNGVPFLVNYGRSSPFLFRRTLSIAVRGPKPVSQLAQYYLRRRVYRMQLGDVAIRLIGSSATPVLVAILGDKRNPGEMRSRAANRIATLGTDAVGADEVLKKCIGDENAVVAYDCAMALGCVASDTTNALKTLTSALKSEKDSVRCGAINGLWALSRRCSVDRSYVIPALTDSVSFIRETATNLLAEIETNAARQTNTTLTQPSP